MSVEIDPRAEAAPADATPSAHQPERRRVLAGVAAANALAAWAGAVALVVGSIDVEEHIEQRLPFDSPVLAGVALAVVVAVPLTALARAAWTRSARTDDLALLTGVVLIGWVILQVLVLRAYSPVQPVYLAIGAGFVAASDRVHLGPRATGVVLVATGAVTLAVGVGLLPHLLDGRVTVVSAMALTLLPGGTALAVVGTRSAWHGCRLLGRVGTAAGSVVAAGLAVWTIAPGVAATHVAPTEITSTPTAVGLGYEEVVVHTADDVQLAAWYVPGTNGAGLVVLHGAGSTRSSVLDQSATLADAGYALLLVDARGHGESHGTAMDFGWFGDRDIAAGTAYLASLPEIDANRIGVVGFSMGGEEAVGAAASDPHIRAVVAEGATARRAADKEWLSDAYGWRGWLQERIEYVQGAVTDYLTEASPPTPLRSAVATAADTDFLLITAGRVADEAHAAAHLATAAPDRVTVWSVPGAGHTDGHATAPDEWRHRVVEFLDRHLR